MGEGGSRRGQGCPPDAPLQPGMIISGADPHGNASECFRRRFRVAFLAPWGRQPCRRNDVKQPTEARRCRAFRLWACSLVSGREVVPWQRLSGGGQSALVSNAARYRRRRQHRARPVTCLADTSNSPSGWGDQATPTPPRPPGNDATLTRRLALPSLSSWAVRDVLALVALLAVVYAMASTCSRAVGMRYDASIVISSSAAVLPSYALQSLTRIVVAYGISLIFSLVYAYIAYRATFAAQILLLAIDVLQSIPLLAFVPSAVLGLIALFPGQRLGVELAAILLLFTSMAWNMLLGFYQSLISIPRDLDEAAQVFRLSAWRRFWLLELPHGAFSLVWNSIISVASGWFFLISIESFSLGPGREYRLPGLGSFLATAADRGQMRSVSFGLATVVAVIILVDFLVWRPLIVWCERFKMSAASASAAADEKRTPAGGTAAAPVPREKRVQQQQQQQQRGNNLTGRRRTRATVVHPSRVFDFPNAWSLAHAPTLRTEFIDDQEDEAVDGMVDDVAERNLNNTHQSAVFAYLQRSPLMRQLTRRMLQPGWEALLNLDRLWVPQRQARPMSGGGALSWPRIAGAWAQMRPLRQALLFAVRALLALLTLAASLWASHRAARVLSAIPPSAWVHIVVGAAYTFGRVLAALGMSMLWTVPVGVAIGRSPALARTLQPLVQIAASVPATAIFPFLLLGLARLGGPGLQIGSVVLMMLGTMWYVLFNVIAGASAIPADFWEVDAVYNPPTGPHWRRLWQRWRLLILPGIFPYLVTGIVTAVGGAWNASIVSEYVQFQGTTLQTIGLGAIISDAAARGDLAMLLAGTLVMAALVLLTNKFVWSPLYKLARERFSLN
ncbi:hypothetical protein CDCA_CDCA09G2733 [Cyanidium caldarium]|uniref:ABC transmembrane type-1 domain-containing protein n=1 Tax=Cyanidium caldarium TaxID=2771 RepID=A0AAV9IX92_CYACA|nr:hypothetical protein CDCA_CDCA09G2733 [Cyanidium caldarium]